VNRAAGRTWASIGANNTVVDLSAVTLPAMTWGDATAERDGGHMGLVPVLDEQLNRALSWLGEPAGGDRAPSSVLAAVAVLGHQTRPLPRVTYASWAFALPSVGAVAWRAASFLTPSDQREALVAFLRAIAAQKVTDGGHWRTLAVVPTRTDVVKPNALLPVRAGALFLTHESETWNSELGGFPWFAVQHTNEPGVFALPDGWRLAWDAPWDNGFTSERITRFCDTLDARGPVDWRPELADELVARTGMARGEARLVLAGLPRVRSWQTSYLDKETRERIGLTAASARASRERLNNLGHWVNRSLLHAAIPTDPADLWTTGPDLDGIAAEWNNRVGRRTAVPEELLLEAEKLLPITSAAEFVSGVANPDTCVWLTTDGFNTVHLEAVSNVLPWLAYRLPVASPLRARLPVALAAARARVSRSDLCCYLGWTHRPDNVLRLLDVDTRDAGADLGWLTLHADSNASYSVYLRLSEFRPEHRDLSAAVMSMLDNRRDNVIEPLTVLRSDALAAACALTSDGEGYYQDPVVSVPDLVGEVAAVHGLARDMAVLYLQLLALPDPTDANVARWTGWNAARLRTARAALAETGLVVTAKRARAGRSVFLPGGWIALTSPHLPVEAWKTPFLRFDDRGRPVAVLAPAGPVEDLFRRAWQRVRDGDAPS
jgi:hypothetical protein